MKNGYPIFKGQMPILPTTITPEGDIDVQSQQKLIDYLLANNAAAVGHLGSASEYHKVSQQDREVLISTLVERVNGRVPTFVGNTALSLKQSLENARIAEKLGVDMLMVCSPIFGRIDQRQLFDYYHALSQEVSLPIIVQDTGASADRYTADFMLRLISDIPTVGYAKTEGQDFLARTCELLAAAKDTVQIIGGAGGFHMIQLLRQGLTAFMTGTEASEIHNAVIHAWLRGDADEAVHTYYTSLLPYLELFNLNPNAMLKYILKKRGFVGNAALLFPDETTPVPDVVLREFDWINQRIAEKKIGLVK